MLKSKVHVVAVLAGLLLAAPALSLAQGPGGGGGRGGFGGGRGGFGRGGGTASLLMMEEVQKELSISDEQKAELTKIGESLRPAGGPGGGGANFEELQKLSEEERAKRFEEMRKQGEERSKKADESIKALLKPEQWTRLSELRIQREGVSALSREEVQKQLALTEEQVTKIKSLNEANRQGGFGGGGGGRNFQDMTDEERQKMMEEFQKRRETFEKDLAAVLTADQAAAWEKLKGAKFEFPRRGGGFGGGGGGRRRPE